MCKLSNVYGRVHTTVHYLPIVQTKVEANDLYVSAKIISSKIRRVYNNI